jgi:hypothetical protein
MERQGQEQDTYILERLKVFLSKTYTIDDLLLDAERGHKEKIRQREKSIRQYWAKKTAEGGGKEKSSTS